MTLIEKLNQIERVDALIRRKATGSPASLAARLGTSERYVYKLINLMKDMGGPISFCCQQNSYIYEAEVTFSIGFVLKENTRTQITGGKSNFFMPLNVLCSDGV